MINRQRVVSEFIELVQTSSPSRHELPVAQRLIPALEALGAQVEVDDAGSKIGGDTGNVLGRIPGTAPSAPPLSVTTYDPATGDYIGPDGKRYTQSDLAHPRAKDWQSLVVPPGQ